MALDGEWESPEGEIAGANVVLKAIARYPNHPRLQMAALDALSHLMASRQVADRVLASKSFLHVTNIVMRMKGYPSIQQAVCLLMWEIAVMDHPPGRHARTASSASTSTSRTRLLINSGAITTLLAAIDHQPMNLDVLKVSIPLLRLLVVRDPETCKAQLEVRYSQGLRSKMSGADACATARLRLCVRRQAMKLLARPQEKRSRILRKQRSH